MKTQTTIKIVIITLFIIIAKVSIAKNVIVNDKKGDACLELPSKSNESTKSLDSKNEPTNTKSELSLRRKGIAPPMLEVKKNKTYLV